MQKTGSVRVDANEECSEQWESVNCDLLFARDTEDPFLTKRDHAWLKSICV